MLWVACAVMIGASPTGKAGSASPEQQCEPGRGITYTIRLEDASAKPLADQPITVRQIEHEFLFGFALRPEEIPTDAGMLQALLSSRRTVFNGVDIGPGNHSATSDNTVAAGELSEMKVLAAVSAGNTQERHIHQAMKRYAGHVAIWEVLTAPLAASIPAEETAEAFRRARSIDPQARLLLSEYLADLPAQAKRLAAYARQCVETGAPLDGLAFELPKHYNWNDAASFLATLDTLAESGVPVYAKHVPYAAACGLLPQLFGDRRIGGVICEHLPDTIPTDPPLYDEWLTRGNLTTDSQGAASFTGNPGDYEVSLSDHVWKVRFAANGPYAATLIRPDSPKPPKTFVMPFHATSAAAARMWQQAIRARLFEIVSAQQPRAEAALDVQLGAVTDKGLYTSQDITFVGNAGTPIEAALTVPHGDGPFPAMVCLHGHGGDRFKVHDPASEYRGLAAEFARRGFVTLAPSLGHMPYAPNQLWNLMRLVDVLETLPVVDEDRIGAAGLSMGGEWTMWLSAMDDRIKVAVVSGWMCSTEGVLSIPNCPCWMPPGLLDLCDIAEVHILIAPRLLLFESAISDGCFPIRATEDGYRKVLRGYTMLGAPMNVRQHIFPGGHAWNGGVAYDLVTRALAMKAPAE